MKERSGSAFSIGRRAKKSRVSRYQLLPLEQQTYYMFVEMAAQFDAATAQELLSDCLKDVQEFH